MCKSCVRGRHCGDHIERETVSQIMRWNRPYLFALFLTILTDCSVAGQKSELESVERMEGVGSVRLTCRGGLSKLAHVDSSGMDGGGCVVGSPSP